MIEEKLEACLEAEARHGELVEHKAVVMNDWDKRIREAEKELEAAEAALKLAMGNEESVIVKGGYQNWKISYTKPRGKVKVTNIDAVPDEFVKIEKKPKLKEIGEYLDEHGLSNWAEIETSEPKIQIKGIKK